MHTHTCASPETLPPLLPASAAIFLCMQVLTLSSDGALVFEEIFMFSHRQHLPYAKFVTLQTQTGLNISATPGHYIWIINDTLEKSGASMPSLVLKRAGDIAIGDRLAQITAFRLAVEPAHVVNIVVSFQQGLYNPHTASGTIVVNSLAATTFTDFLPPYTHMHALMTVPARIMFSACKSIGGFALCERLNEALLHLYFRYPMGSMMAMIFAAAKNFGR